MKLQELYQPNFRKEPAENKTAETIDAIEHEGQLDDETPVSIQLKQVRDVETVPNTASFSDTRGIGRQL